MGAQESRKCGADFKMDVAILLDASGQEFEFERGLDFARNVINFLPDIGGDVRISLVPYSWEMFKPTNELADNISKDSALSLTRRISFNKRAGSSMDLHNVTNKIIREKLFRGEDRRPNAKRVVIILYNGQINSSTKRTTRSYWEGVEPDEVPFVISLAVRSDATKEMMKISENPCFVINAPSWDTLSSSGLRMAQQRLCDIAQSPNESVKTYHYARGRFGTKFERML